MAGKKSTAVPPARPRPRGLRRAAQASEPAIAALAGRKGFAEARVLLNWAEIVGPALADTCSPVTVRYGTQRALGATLVVETDGARATEVTHLAPALVERVNSYYGYRAISRISVRHANPMAQRAPRGQGLARAQSGFAEGQARFDGPAPGPKDVAPGPDPEDCRRAAELAASIASPDLRAALTTMGGYVLARARTETAPTAPVDRGPDRKDRP